MALGHIMLVDDDELLRRSLSFGLQRAGYRVSTAAMAEDALALSRQDAPDLVLLDIGLPGMDGLDALKEFRESQRVPVIFLTGRRREMDQVLGLELGADDYVTKPFDKDVLLARIKVLLRRTRGESERKNHWRRKSPVSNAGVRSRIRQDVSGKIVDQPPRARCGFVAAGCIVRC